MHPTAHGFNFGLKGASWRGIPRRATAVPISRQVRCCRRTRAPIVAPPCRHLATHAVAKLYTSESLPSRVLRDAFLGIGQRLTPFKRLVAASLTGATERRAA